MTDKVQKLYEALPNAESIEDLGVLIDTIRDVYDLSNVAYHAISLGQSFVVASQTRSSAGVLARNAGFWQRHASHLVAVSYAPSWGQRYVEADYVRIDPVIESAATSFVPLDWKRLDWTSKKRKQFLLDAVEHGVGNQGYTIPVRGPNGQSALFTVNKIANDNDWERFINTYRSDLLVVSHFFHQKVLDIVNIFGPVSAPQLSAREKDTLAEISRGKSRAQVAHDLGISENTLRVYLDSARSKLGALNIPHAIAIGISRGIINI